MQKQTPSPSGTVEDAAELLRIGRTLAYQEAKAGRLPGVIRIGRLYRVSLPVLYQHLGLAWPPATHSDVGPDAPEAAT
jgi:excisionase family DNA binding protein